MVSLKILSWYSRFFSLEWRGEPFSFSHADEGGHVEGPPQVTVPGTAVVRRLVHRGAAEMLFGVQAAVCDRLTHVQIGRKEPWPGYFMKLELTTPASRVYACPIFRGGGPCEWLAIPFPLLLFA